MRTKKAHARKLIDGSHGRQRVADLFKVERSSLHVALRETSNRKDLTAHDG